MLDADGVKFSKYYPLSEDLTLQVLKGHLLVEEMLLELFWLKLKQPKVLEGSSGARFDCHQVICLVEAMSPQSSKLDWVWKAAKKLNSLRNKLAHNLEPKGVDHKVTDLVNYVSNNSSDAVSTARKSDPSASDLMLSIMAIGATLSVLKDTSAQTIV